MLDRIREALARPDVRQISLHEKCEVCGGTADVRIELPSGRYCYVCNQCVVNAKKPRDFDYYIGKAQEAEKRSNMLWQAAYGYIRGVLERAKSEGKTLLDAAAILEKSAGKKSKNEPVSIGSFRVAARQIRAGEVLVLL